MKYAKLTYINLGNNQPRDLYVNPAFVVELQPASNDRTSMVLFGTDKTSGSGNLSSTAEQYLLADPVEVVLVALEAADTEPVCKPVININVSADVEDV